RKVIILENQNVLRVFTATVNVIGQYVNVNDIAFQLIGYYEHPWRSETYIPYTTAKSLNGYNDKISPIRITLKNVSDAAASEQFETDMREVMAKANHHAPDDTSALWVWNQFSSYLSAMDGMSILSGAMWVIGILTLLSGLVGVSNIMFVSVRERTHEIGIRRAIGARPRTILFQIILESVTLTTLFGYLGILLGTIAVQIISHYIGDSEFIVPPSVNFKLAIQVTVLMIVAGALAGIFPARRALKINAVEALRAE
ncbi:MAG: ABC transporter permease, partial [Muribaculum sp.]|nr:ABC transporter permease [Muribaculum sp.]